MLDPTYHVQWETKELANSYVLKDKLGEGEFGVVYKCIRKKDAAKEAAGGKVRMYALKQIHMSGKKDDPVMLQDASAEVYYLKKLRESASTCNPFVICYIRNFLGTDGYLNIVTDFITGRTFDSITTDNKVGGKKTLPEVFRRLLLTALRGLEYMHKRDVVHRDIHSSNLMIMNYDTTSVSAAASAQVIFIDVGLACDSAEVCRNNTLEIVQYTSPEMLSADISNRQLTLPEYKASDVWRTALVFERLNSYKSLFHFDYDRQYVVLQRNKNFERNVQKILDGPSSFAFRAAQLAVRRGVLTAQTQLLQRQNFDLNGPTTYDTEGRMANITTDEPAGHVLRRMLEFDWRQRIMPLVGVKTIENFDIVKSRSSSSTVIQKKKQKIG